MKSILPRKYTLDDLLRADPVGSLYAALQVADDAFLASNAADAKEAEETYAYLKKLYAEHPTLYDDLRVIDARTTEGLAKASQLIGIPGEQLRRVKHFSTERQKAGDCVVPDAMLVRSWRALKYRAGIKDVGQKDFPKTLDRPMLVLYSADWCSPCRMMRPTFARLVPFFDKAEARYCHEDEWRRNRGVKFIPQFVAYFPGGGSVSSHVGSTTKDIWETMNKLIVLGKSWEGVGELVCDKDSCRIVAPSKK